LVHIWDIAANKDLVAPLKAKPWSVISVTYSPDSKKVAVGCDTIAIYETATGKRLNPTPENQSPVQQIEYGAGGKLLAVWRQDQTIEVWDTPKCRKLTTIKAKIGRFSAMAFSPGGKYLTTGEGDFNQGVLCHWDPRSGKRQRVFPQGKGWLGALSYSAAGDTLACIQTTSQDSVFILWDPATGRERRRITAPVGGGRKPRLSPDGRLLACAKVKDSVALWDTRTAKLVRDFGEGTLGGRELLAFSPDGRSIATPAGQGVDGTMSIHPDVVLWETATGQERLHITMNEGQVNNLAFSPDGRLLASAGRTETIRLWDIWTGKQVGHFTGHRGPMTSLAFAPDGKTLASGGLDSTVLIWDVSGLLPTAKKPAEKLSPAALTRCWNDLAGADAARAYQSIMKLAQRPGQAEGLLKNKLTANPGVDGQRLARLIADLDARNFKVREKASKELATLGRSAEGALTRALEGKPSAEVNRRIQDLLHKLDGTAEDPEQRRLLRAIEVLERLGTREASRLLGKLAKKATNASAAWEAKASIERLGKAGRGAP
jgi:WD40 repeat protein